jgi:hypothetical protein
MILAASAFLALAWPGTAQNGEITTRTKPSSTQIRSWLASDDPRLVAWGAYFARETADDSAIVPMQQLVEQWKAPENASEPEAQAQSDAMAEVLDAIIQRNKSVSSEGLEAIAELFPTQAEILAARLPIDEATPLLEKWYEKRGDSKNPTLARIAAMLLTKAPPAGFAASVLSEAEEQYFISVVDPGAGVGFGGSSCCGSALARAHPGWPPLFQYRLTEGDGKPNAPLVVEAGGDRVTYERGDAGKGFGSCGGVRGLDDETRHALLAEMLGIEKDAMPWKPWKRDSFEWEGQSVFMSELREIVDGEEARLQSTVDDLYAEGLLTFEEAGSARPKLVVRIDDERGDRSDPLPKIEGRDARTLIAMNAADAQ